ncbi:hypothetical protein [Rathayibacter rathayi]|uniref:hypothetical protein n=1 Tax=Rathayibacter rathayi TaxID=33887 RepID=UPI0015E20D63|nr:hypothetical protein [Rathayibacter rathayi]
MRTLDELRATLDLLRDPGSPRRDLAPQPTLGGLVAGSGIEVAQSIALPPDLPLPVQRAVYRFVQEGLTNARTHSTGAAVRIDARACAGQLDVHLEVGPATLPLPELPGARVGLTGLSERAALLGGSVRHALRPDGSQKASIPASEQRSEPPRVQRVGARLPAAPRRRAGRGGDPGDPSSVIPSCSLPLVVVDPLTAQTELPSVATDDFGGALLATSHLIGLGHWRIGHIAGRPDLESSHRRGAGYQRALADAGLADDPALVRVGFYRHDPSLAAARELLALPERLSVVSYDEVQGGSRIVPALTTVRQPLHRARRPER